MNWKRRLRRNLLFAVLGGLVANIVYFCFEFSRSLQRVTIIALGPAINIVNRYLDPNYAAGVYLRYLEEFGVNILLYAFWIFVILLTIDLLRQLKRRLTR